jgi:hypothetical protein
VRRITQPTRGIGKKLQPKGTPGPGQFARRSGCEKQASAMTDPRRFLLVWIGCLAGLTLVVGGLNLLVDPYDVFGMKRIAGVSLLKPITRNHVMLAKTFQVGRAHPVTVLIGSSPVHIGVDAAAPEWPASMRPVYNYGIPGAYETSTGLRTLQEAVATGGVKNAVVFLDFQNFFSPEHPDPVLLEADRRFRFQADGTPNPDRLMQLATDRFLSVGTMGALIDSLTTIALQDRPNVLNLAADGSGTEADFIDAARSDGMHDLFAQKDAVEAERARAVAPIMAGWRGPLPDMDAVAAIVAFARAHDVRLTLVIAPHHVDADELYWRAGLWPRVEQLKAELTTLVAAQGGAVSLWDFLEYGAFTTEPVPPEGDRRTPTSWFWEPTHFKKQLGAVMIRRMFGSGGPSFGIALTPQNLAEHNARIRADRRALAEASKALAAPLPGEPSQATAAPLPREPSH